MAIFGYGRVSTKEQTFTQHLDAGAVDQEVQSYCCQRRTDRHRTMLLAPANGTEVGHLPV
ncbi:hypothetical protein GCM10009094_40590 [Massilia aurea]